MKPEKKPITRKAYAKVNFTFEVLGKRRDGYHEIVSIMQAINLCDVLTFEPHDHIHLACDVPELVSPNNLVYKAAKMMQELSHGRHGVAISLNKYIPLASGLGGGSSNAAVILEVLNEMWELRLSLRRLLGLAAQLGSDVPFFVSSSQTALATGRGDKVEALPPLPKTWLVLLMPPIEMANKTREMYANLDPSRFTKGQHARRLADLIKRRKRLTNRDCFNVFDPISLSLFPGMDRYRERFLAAGASEVHLAGAGPAMFTLVTRRAEGEAIAHRLKQQRLVACLAETL